MINMGKRCGIVSVAVGLLGVWKGEICVLGIPEVVVVLARNKLGNHILWIGLDNSLDG